MDQLTIYDVDMYRDEAGDWIADVPDVPGAHSFAKRIDQITANIREAIALALDIDDPGIDTSQRRMTCDLR